MSEPKDLCDCGAPKLCTSKNCKPCATKITGAARRFLNHNCVDCGKRIAKGAQRCKPCFYITNRGVNNPRWRGGRYIGQNGYRYINGSHLDDPRFAGRHQVAEHTIVMEQIIGRPLRKGESVHHKNGVRHDNRPENLELWVKSQPAGQRVSDMLAWAKEIIAIYGDA